ncbi:MAG: ATP-binding cassette domain-containing protein [Candidatus Izemoplasma sp.]
MIKLNEIHKVYTQGKNGYHALKGITLYFERGEIIAIYGPSGCGKTTLLNILGGLDTPTSGDMVIDDRLTTQFFEKEWDFFRNHRIGFIFQSYNLIEHLPVIENVALSIKLSGVSHKESHLKAMVLLEKVGLKDHVNKLPNELSGGERQRVSIARALISDPDIILADEPTGALDMKTGTEIMDLIKSISKDKLVILVTHNKKIAKKYSTRFIELKDGVVVHDSDPKDKKMKIVLKREKNRKKLKFKEAIRLALFNIRGKKWRTFLVSLGLSIGIIGLILIDSLFSTIRAGLDSKDTILKNNPDLYIYTEHDDSTSTSELLNIFNSEFDYFKEVFYAPTVGFTIGENISSGTVYNDIITFSGMASPTNQVLLDTFTNIIDDGRLPENSNEFAIPLSAAYSLINENIYVTETELWDMLKNKEYKIYSSYYYTINYSSINSGLSSGDCIQTGIWDGNFANPPSGYDEVVLGDFTQNISSLYDYVNTPIRFNETTQIYCSNYSDYSWNIDYTTPKSGGDTFTLVGIFDNNLFTTMLFDESFINNLDYQDDHISSPSDYNYEFNQINERYLGFIKSDLIDQKIEIIKDIEAHGFIVIENYGSDFDLLLGLTSLFMYIIQFIFSAIVSIAVITGGLMLLLILSISILERKREIGLIRSMGGTRNDVKIIFTGETVIIGFIAGILSVFLSIVLVIGLNIYLANNYNDLILEYLPYVDPKKVLTINYTKLGFAILGSIGIALISGLIPSIKAGKQLPIEALRNE